jgi:hypothetical protein
MHPKESGINRVRSRLRAVASTASGFDGTARIASLTEAGGGE